MSPPPYPFALNTYASWHNAQYPADDPLPENVDKLRTELVVGSREQLAALSLIFVYAFDYSRNEYQQSTRTSTGYHNALSAAVVAGPGSIEYDQLFKPTSSIINKLWRKNQDTPPAHLGNIRETITDLVRTDIAATTLDSAAFLATRMNALPGIIYEPQVGQLFDETIASIRFEPEMKMESGYFAYHGLVHFKTGLVVEVQIYSDLMKQWRRLSHTLYELARAEPVRKYEFNSKESRLISLGHLLHLAECQLQQLRQEFGGR